MSTASSPITSHVLDTALGRPAAGVPVTIEIERTGAWQRIGGGVTNDDGRVPGLLSPGTLEPGRYRATFDTAAYFALQNTRGFYPYVQVVFEIAVTNQHYHIPLLLSPYGYSTYRGS